LIQFSNILKSLRKQAGVTAEQLAETLGLKKRMIYAYESDSSKPTFDNLLKLADMFDVSLDYLVGRAKIYSKPEGDVEYFFRGHKHNYVGAIKYVFGVVLDEKGKVIRQFLVIKDLERSEDDKEELVIDDGMGSDYVPYRHHYLFVTGNFINAVIESDEPFMFLSLVYFLREKIGFEYHAFKTDRVSIIVENGGEYRELAMDEGSSAMLYTLSFDEKYVKDWLKLTPSKREKILSESYKWL